MKGKLRRHLAIRELILQGRTQEQVAEKLNVSTSTVYRHCKNMRQASIQWIADLAEYDYARTYKDALDGLQNDLGKLLDMLETQPVKDSPELQLQIRKQMTAVREARLRHLMRGPMVWSMEMFRKKYAPTSMRQPTVKSLGGITGTDT